MHCYLSKWYLNSLSNFNYEKVEKIASVRPLLDQIVITTKIALDVMKVGVHSYLPNGYLNTVSNFNFEKVKKSAFLRTSFYLP